MYSNIIGNVLSWIVYLLVSESTFVPSSTGTDFMVFLQLSEAYGTQNISCVYFVLMCNVFAKVRFFCVYQSAVNSRVSPRREGTSCHVLLRDTMSK